MYLDVLSLSRLSALYIHPFLIIHQWNACLSAVGENPIHSSGPYMPGCQISVTQTGQDGCAWPSLSLSAIKCDRIGASSPLCDVLLWDMWSDVLEGVCVRDKDLVLFCERPLPRPLDGVLYSCRKSYVCSSRGTSHVDQSNVKEVHHHDKRSTRGRDDPLLYLSSPSRPRIQTPSYFLPPA